MEGNPDFYKLDRSKPVRTEEHVGKINAFLIIGIIFAVFITAFIIYTFATDSGYETQSFMGAGFFMFFSLALLGFGIYQQIKYGKLSRAERELLKNCLCTDGVITECNSKRLSYTSGDTDRYYYDVTLIYSYYNEQNQPQYKTFTKRYNADPEFYVGQWLMIAFNDTDSAILKRFEFIKEDEERFLKNQSARSDDDFDGLDGELVEYLGTAKPLTPIVKNKAYLWLACFFMCFLVVYSAVICLMGVPVLLKSETLTEILIGCLFTIIPPAALLTAIISLLCKYYKRRKQLKSILNNNPYFTRGKIFFSEMTYGNKNRKQVLYCYVDKWKERHTEVLKAALTTALIRPQDAFIAYTPDGKSVPLDICSIPRDEQIPDLK